MSLQIPELVDFFKQINFVRVYPKGQVICEQDQPSEFVYMVTEGIVKAYDLDAVGTERTITNFAEKNIFPVTWLLHSPPKKYLYFYEAFTNAKCYVAEAADLRNFIHEHPQLSMTVSDALAKNYINSIGRLQSLEKSHINERLAYVLYFLASKLGTKDGDIVRINAVITQEDIARLAGVTRESMSHEINRVRSKKIIWRRRHSTYIDMNRIDSELIPKIFIE
jgi:CRP-like cAMP-binding protein